MVDTEVILITGCASGIGKALAQDLHRRITKKGTPAFKVYASDYRVEPLQALADEGIRTLQLDVTSQENIQKAVQFIIAEDKHIDAVVCNAGLSGRGFIAEMDYNIVEKTFAVNVHGVFKVAQAVAPYMMAQRSGKIATVCSVNSYLAHPFLAPYVGSKAAVLNMTEALAMELHPFGIHVTSIVPGYVKSDIIQNSLTESDSYNKPESAYYSYYRGLAVFRDKTKDKGISTQEAAKHIGDGVSRSKPPRFLYTGSEYRIVLFYAFVQHWLSNSFIANMVKGMFGLSKPYAPYVATNGDATPTPIAASGAAIKLQKEE